MRSSRGAVGDRGLGATLRELNWMFQGMSTSYDFWIDDGLALVGSPDTMIRRLKEQH